MAKTQKLESQRIEFLDGLRGVAILLVMLFHAYTRWKEIMPYGDRFADFTLFRHGWLGVELFFIISGFVIFMTLERCINFRDFILRRWLRLFPAMLICSLITYFTAPLFTARPAGVPELHNILTGLVFVDPETLSWLFHTSFDSIEGAFWSLYIEMRFYFIFGLAFFFFGWRYAVAILVFLFCSNDIILAAIKHYPTVKLSWLDSFGKFVGTSYYGWFAIGALLYKYYHECKRKYLWLAIVVAVAACYDNGKGFAGILVLIYIFSLNYRRVQRILSCRFLVFIGFVSYPLYLIHENMIVSMTIQIGNILPGALQIMTPLLPMVVVVAISWVVTKYLEPALKKIIRRPYNWFGAVIGAWPARIK